MPRFVSAAAICVARLRCSVEGNGDLGEDRQTDDVVLTFRTEIPKNKNSRGGWDHHAANAGSSSNPNRRIESEQKNTHPPW